MWVGCQSGVRGCSAHHVPCLPPPPAANAHRRSPSETVPSRGLAPPAGLELQDQDLLALCRDPALAVRRDVRWLCLSSVCRLLWV